MYSARDAVARAEVVRYAPSRRIGITETSDAVVVVVSEETGGISVAFRGQIERNIAPQNLQQAIAQHLIGTTEKRSRRKGTATE